MKGGAHRYTVTPPRGLVHVVAARLAVLRLAIRDFARVVPTMEVLCQRRYALEAVRIRGTGHLAIPGSRGGSRRL